MTTYQSQSTRVRQLFSTLAAVAASNPVLLEGEKWNEKDATTGRATGRTKTGDGVISGTAPNQTITGTAFNDLPFDPSGGGASLSDATPQALGTAAAGTASTASRSDHRHAMPTAAGVGADATGTAVAAVAAHAAAADPHPTYTTAAEAAAAAPVQSVAGRTGAVTLTAADVSGAVSTSDSRLSDAREWSAATVTQAEAEAGSSTARLAFTPLRVFQAIAAWWAASASKTKLDGIAAGATVNSSDATLLARANHTGTQAGSTVTGAYTAAGMTMATARILGRSTAATGSVEEITIGSGLSLSANTLTATGSGGGGGTPGGSTTQVQYNNAGAFAGAANVDIISDNLQLTAPSTAPAAAAASSVVVYPVGIADRFMLAMQGPTGAAALLQPSIFSNNIMLFSPQSSTTGTGSTAFQIAWNAAGTVSHPAPDASSAANAGRRTNYTNVVTTTNQLLGVRFSTDAERCFFRGNVAGTGGFFYFSRIRLTYPASTTRLFTGLQGSAASVALAQSDTPPGPHCGLSHLTTDPSTGSGALNFVTHDGTTRNALAINFTADLVASSPLLDFYMYCPSNGGTIFFRLDDVTNGVTYTNSTSANLPGATVMMSPQCQASNGTANVTVATVAMSIYRIYVESAF